MKMTILFLLLATFLFSNSSLGQSIRMTVEGTAQGRFKGESQRLRYVDKIEITGYVQEITSPRDLATGMATGRRSHQPFIILKPSGNSSPQFFQALVTNEVLRSVVIEMYKIDPTQPEVLLYTVTLENASVSGYKQFIGPLENEKFNPANNVLYDEIKLTFQKITVVSAATNTTATDTRQ